MSDTEQKVDFFVVGAMKSGSTTLYEYLTSHPDIYMSPLKETQFFSRKNRYDLGIDWYHQLFLHSSSHQKLGEASTCYSRFPKFSNVPGKIYSYNPHAKIIYIVRNPVARSYSHYVHNMQIDERNYKSFSDALEKNHQILLTSMYMFQIEQYLEYFDRKHIHIIKFEDFVNEPRTQLEKLYSFLEIDTNYTTMQSDDVAANVSGEKLALRKAREYLYKIRNMPIIRPTVNTVIPKKYRNQLLNRILDTYTNSYISNLHKKIFSTKVTPLTEEHKEYILNKVKDDIIRLQEFSQIDLSDWLA